MAWGLTFLVFLGLQVALSQDFKYDRTKVYMAPSKKLVDFNLGYHDLLSAAFWVRVVQDFHVCDQNTAPVEYPPLMNHKNPLDEILSRQLPASKCERGWVFQMLDVISDLEPEFKSVYTDGGTMLSVVVDDRQGAHGIFQKGVKRFPQDWQVLYRAAYHSLFEMQNQEEAERLLFRAAKAGAPPWTYSLAAKLSSRTGRAAMALTVLEEVVERNPAGVHSLRIQSQIKALKAFLKSQSPQ